MSVSRITARFTRSVLTQCRSSPHLVDRRSFHGVANTLISPSRIHDKVLFVQHPALNSSAFQWLGFSSSASSQSNEKEPENKGDNEAASPAVDAQDQTEPSSSDDLESDLSKDDLVKLVAEKEELVVLKQEELEKMKDKLLRTYAEMENVKERTRRESENVKKFAIQNFAKGLLDVADNLGRAASAAKQSYSKIPESEDTTGAHVQLRSLLDGVEMIEKQLSEVLKKFGIEKYDPINEEFDPNSHNAVFQVPDASKPAGHVAVVLKSGYRLHDRVIRPAEVGVTVAVENEEA